MYCKISWLGLFLLLSIFFSSSSMAEEISFAQQDRERLIRLEVKAGEVDKRFIRLEAKVGEVDKHLIRLETKVGEVDKGLIRLEAKVGEIDKHFEQIDKRLEFMQHLMIGMLAVFGGLCGIFAGLLVWDRRTFKEKAKDEALKEIGEKQIKPILSCMKEYSKVEPKFREVLARYHLL